MNIASLVLCCSRKGALRRAQVADVEIPGTAASFTCRDALHVHDIVAIGDVHIPVDATRQLFCGVLDERDDVLSVLVSRLKNARSELGGNQVVFGKSFLRGLSVLGNLGVDEVLQVLRVVVVFAFVVEVESVIDVVAGTVLRVNDL